MKHSTYAIFFKKTVGKLLAGLASRKSRDAAANRRWYWSWWCLAVIFVPLSLAFVLYYNFNILFNEARERRLIQCKSDLAIATSNFNELLMKAQIVLSATTHSVEQMLADGSPQHKYRKKFLEIDSMFRENLNMNFTCLYGLVNDQYTTTSQWIPPSDYLPQKRPWYTEAIKGGRKITLIPPYLDPDTGGIVVSMVTALSDNKTVVAIDHYYQELLDSIDVKTNDGIRNWYLVDKGGKIIQKRINTDADVDFSVISNEIPKLAQNAKGGAASSIVKMHDEQYTLIYGELLDGWYGITVIPHEKLKVGVLKALMPHFIMTIAVTGVIWGIMFLCLYVLHRGKKKAEEVERIKTSFFATVSHDIRTPLNSIIGFSQLLKHDIDNRRLALEYVNDIIVSGNMLAQLINDILDLCKLDADKFQYNYEFADFAKLAEETLSTFTPIAKAKGNRLINSISKNLPQIKIDRQRTRQVLLNIIGNAAKFTEKGEIEVIGEFVKSDSKFGKLVYTVRDTGIGIPPKAIGKILNPFVQLGSGDNGTGLGLSICSKLISQMHGTLSIDSEVGKGSSFKVVVGNVEYKDTVPIPETPIQRQTAASPDGARPVDAHPQDKPQSPQRKIKLLLVDDIALNLKVLSRLLTNLCDAECILSLSGKQALETIAADRFDAVLADIQMPEMDGHQLLKEIRKTKSPDQLRVFAVSADINMVHTWEDDGFDGLLLKPVTVNILTKFINSNFSAHS